MGLFCSPLALGLGSAPVPFQGSQSPPTALLCSAWATWVSVDVADLVEALRGHVSCGQGGTTGVSLQKRHNWEQHRGGTGRQWLWSLWEGAWVVAMSPKVRSPALPLRAAGLHPDPHVTVWCDVLLEVPTGMRRVLGVPGLSPLAETCRGREGNRSSPGHVMPAAAVRVSGLITFPLLVKPQ